MMVKCRLNTLLIIFAISIDVCYSYIENAYGKKNKIVKAFPKTGRRDMKQDKCWIRFDSKKHFNIMDKLDESYAKVRQEYQNAVDNNDFDAQMIDVMVKSRGAAEREIHKVDGNIGLISAGINLGGYCMMRMPNSLLFFHRMKLRNNTHFRVTSLHNDLLNMVLKVRISLNDLHLLGSYDRSITDKDPSILYYTPTYGQIEFLLKNVRYSMEGRYRLLKDRLNIELIISEIMFDDVMMTYLNNATNEPIRLKRKNIEDFLDRLKNDLDKWLKDYFNDYLMFFGIFGKENNSKLLTYDKKKAIQLNDYTDNVIRLVKQKLHKIKAASVKLPQFKIFTANGMELFLKDGELQGLDSMYRRSVATGKKAKNIRKVDAVIGFSDLKVTYKYDGLISSNTPALSGVMIMSADELTARMGIDLLKNSESANIKFHFLEQAKPESLTIEGGANRIISNFKYIIEQHIIAIMSNALVNNIKLLGSITRCVPQIIGQDNNSYGNEDDELNSFKEYKEEQDAQTQDTESLETKPENNPKHENKPESNPEHSNEFKSEESGANSENEKQDDNMKESPNNTMVIVENDSVDLELPSNEDTPKEKLHMNYVQNFTLTKINPTFD